VNIWCVFCFQRSILPKGFHCFFSSFRWKLRLPFKISNSLLPPTNPLVLQKKCKTWIYRDKRNCYFIVPYISLDCKSALLSDTGKSNIGISLLIQIRYNNRFIDCGTKLCCVCHLQGRLFKLGLVNSPKCDRCKQESETASHLFYCHCEALATLRFRHLGHHSLKPGDFEDISVSRILQCVQGAGLLNEWAKWLHKRLINFFFLYIHCSVHHRSIFY
jgi:hypothetical protein